MDVSQAQRPASPARASPSRPRSSHRLFRRLMASLRAVLRRLSCASSAGPLHDSPRSARPAAPATIVSQDAVATLDQDVASPIVEKAELPVTTSTQPVQPTTIIDIDGPPAPTVSEPKLEVDDAEPEPEFLPPVRSSQRRPLRPATLNRLRRKCHKCQSPFIFAERECQECDHVQCDACPWETPRLAPANSASAPQRTYKQPRMRVHRRCHQCNAHFGSADLVCATCQHQKCADCLRFPQRRPKTPEFDPEVLQSLNTRLAAYTVVSTGPPAVTVS